MCDSILSVRFYEISDLGLFRLLCSMPLKFCKWIIVIVIIIIIIIITKVSKNLFAGNLERETHRFPLVLCNKYMLSVILQHFELLGVFV